MNVLVLGGYGLIGLSISEALDAAGHTVTGLGRSIGKGRKAFPQIDWIEADIAEHVTSGSWDDILAGIDVVVNASGALQSGARDNVDRVQREAMIALIDSCAQNNIAKFIQISAPGVDEQDDTLFYRSKAAADAHLKASGLNWTIFRPGLVIAPDSFGGTSLIRLLAAFPLVQPIALADAPIQTVSVWDVAQAVCVAAEGNFLESDFDLVEPKTNTLSEIVLAFRHWLGFKPPRMVLIVPSAAAFAIARLGDLAGWLGWRPALRTTALKVLRGGVQGDPEAWQSASGKACRSLEDTLQRLPATIQERTYASMALIYPLLLLVLSAFWLISGGIGFARMEHAQALIAPELGAELASTFVVAGAFLDIAIGLGLLIRRFTLIACFASLAVSAAYLLGSLIVLPSLWLDPLGPMVKVFPAMALALAVAALTKER